MQILLVHNTTGMFPLPSNIAIRFHQIILNCDTLSHRPFYISFKIFESVLSLFIVKVDPWRVLQECIDVNRWPGPPSATIKQMLAESCQESAVPWVGGDFVWCTQHKNLWCKRKTDHHRRMDHTRFPVEPRLRPKLAGGHPGRWSYYTPTRLFASWLSRQYLSRPQVILNCQNQCISQ